MQTWKRKKTHRTELRIVRHLLRSLLFRQSDRSGHFLVVHRFEHLRVGVGIRVLDRSVIAKPCNVLGGDHVVERRWLFSLPRVLPAREKLEKILGLVVGKMALSSSSTPGPSDPHSLSHHESKNKDARETQGKGENDEPVVDVAAEKEG